MSLRTAAPRPCSPTRWRAAAVTLLVLTTLAALAAAGPAAAQDGDPLARARELVDSGAAREALDHLDPLLRRRPKSAEAWLLRSTARFMLGDVDGGRDDLDRALRLDPELRQGWLNRAGLAVSEERYDDALAAFRRAEGLDPRAPENDLNIGTVLLLQGELEPASERFARYLASAGATAEGYYLVASNYALAGYEALAVQHLQRAVERTERMRLRARTDPNFSSLGDNPRFLRLLSTDPYEPPPGAHTAARTYGVRYDGGRGPLLPAVLDALQLGRHPFDPRVEVTESWALIWGELRIKVEDAPQGGAVSLSAPAQSFTPQEWEERADDLLDAITRQAILRTPRDRGGEGGDAP